jgi:DNA-binding response OmpR family regulator
MMFPSAAERIASLRGVEIQTVASSEIRVLVVEDEDLTRQAIALGLRHQGLLVTEAADGAACLAQLKRMAIDLVVLDLGLPDLDGIRLAAELRSRARLGLIVVTRRAAVEARIEALDIGADDYLVKPVDYAELAARIRSVVRRRGPLPRRQLPLGPWMVDLDARTVTATGLDAGLTRGEFDILARLADAEGRVVSRDDLLEVMSRNPGATDPRSVDMLVSRLRRKLAGGGPQGELIATAPGYGYRLNMAAPEA